MKNWRTVGKKGGLNTFRPGQNSIIWHQTEAGTAR